MDKEIIYIADPMCSWCWGFAPVAAKLKQEFAQVAGFRLILGGLRPGDRAQAMDRGMARMLESHWRRVAQQTGQPINYEFLKRENFVFDTEPASRAVVSVRRLAPELVLEFFTSLEHAFYVDNVDITREDNYAPLLAKHGIDRARFTELFNDEDVRRETYRDFDNARRLGAQGFPTVALRKGRAVGLLTIGYQRYESLAPAIRYHFDVAAEEQDTGVRQGHG
jgi:putative protein-disulfide isomerase